MSTVQPNSLFRICEVNVCACGWQVNEMELTRTTAERVLREHKGNVFEALVTLTN